MDSIQSVHGLGEDLRRMVDVPVELFNIR